MRIHLLIPILTLACRTETQTIEVLLPVMNTSSDLIDFGNVDLGESGLKSFTISNDGQLPMGLHPLAISAEGFESNFSVAYDVSTILCPEEQESDYAIIETDMDELNNEDGDFVLNPGCSISVDVGYAPIQYGPAHAAIVVESFIEPKEDEAGNVIPQSRFYRDARRFMQSIRLMGDSFNGVGNIVITPRTLDFGNRWMGESSAEQVIINNVGDGDLTILEPVLDPTCNEAFSLNFDAIDSDYVIKGGDSTLFEVIFNPINLDPAFCTVTIGSDDAETPEMEVTLKGNVGKDPNNVAPTVNLIYPTEGHVHNPAGDLEFSLQVFDANQPANTLLCKIKSMNLDAGVYNCAPEDESGYVHVSIPTENLEQGADTFLVTVTDRSELQSFASTTIIYQSDFPESDDDGDGYGNEGDGPLDCDDNNINIYPNAAEIADGLDNDCDGATDENTVATDDDGDSVSEEDGDCDDNDFSSYPGAPELPDLKDNDCDGTIDEYTSLSDDDGDGFSEVDNDCNDNDPEINPAAVEYCDNIDNNCNNLRDEQEGCVSLDAQPYIIGGIHMEPRALQVGESATMTIFVYEAEGEDLSFSWEEDSAMSILDHTAISEPTAKTITWTAPESLGSGKEGQIFSVYVVVEDEDGNQDWVFDEISVYRDPVEDNVTKVESSGSGCSSSSSASLFLVPFIGLGLAARRRRDRKSA